MTLAAGTRLGLFEITGKIGAGGMGEVYRASDPKLGREVAIKVLPAELAADADRLLRFRREAEVLAALNHPNIAHIYGLEDGDGETALVMELIEGPTLADRIAAGPIPPAEALEIALQIAEALEAAHARGIVHRDLKPANVKLRSDGLVKVLDFGIAKALDTHSDTSGPLSTALTSPTTARSGVVLGTAAYMSPEQARGKPVDQRSDIWAFGCVLYEMLTGQPAFGGEDETTTIARVLERETDMSALPRSIAESTRKALKLCLVKDPRNRVADIRDVRLVLKGTFDDDSPKTQASSARLAAAVLVAAVIAGGGAWLVKPGDSGVDASPVAAPVIRARLDLNDGTRLSAGFGQDEAAEYLQRPSRPSLSLSPDGSLLAYTAHDGSGSHLYLRRLDRDEATRVANTEGAGMPFFSADGSSVGFWVDGLARMRVLDIASGEIRSIALEQNDLVAPGLSHASWTADDTLLISLTGGIYEMPSTGGSMSQVTTPAAGESLHVYPQLLPERRGILYTATSGPVPSEWSIRVQPLDGGDAVTLIEGGTGARYVPTGHLLFVRSGVLLAVPLDLETLSLNGAPSVVVEDVMLAENGINSSVNTGAAQFAVADNGTLVVVPGGPYPDVIRHSLHWLGLDGSEETIDLPPARYLWQSVSPDRRYLSYGVGNFGDVQIWIYDLANEVPIPLTTEGENIHPIWSPDSSRLAFQDSQSQRMFTIEAEGGHEPEPIGDDLIGIPMSWSSDNVLAFFGGSPLGSALMTLRMDGQSEPEEYLAPGYRMDFSTFSPDGDWIAYTSQETGELDVYVRRFPEGAPVYRISTGGAAMPVWSPDGTRLYYLTPGDAPATVRVMAVDIDTSDGFTRSRPAELLTATDLAGSFPLRSLDIDPNGERLLIKKNLPQPDAQAVTSVDLVVNWFEELTERVPVPEG